MTEYKDNLPSEANSFFEVLEQVSYLAPLNKPMLTIGECGTSKELIVSCLHYLPSRWQGPFTFFNYVTLNEDLLDSELFGHEAGALTGAQKRHPGRFEHADSGTLLLDELVTTSIMVQGELLCVIEYDEPEHVDGGQPLQVNVQLVYATNVGLPAMVNEGTFRADLFDRLTFDVMQLPLLHKRESDIMLIVEHFTVQMYRETKLPLFPGLTEHTREILLNYCWPGDIHELKKVVEHSVHCYGINDYLLDDIIVDPFKRRPSGEATAVPENTSLPTLPLNLYEFQMQQEKELLQLSLQQGKYNQKRAAELLELAYHQFHALSKEYQI